VPLEHLPNVRCGPRRVSRELDFLIADLRDPTKGALGVGLELIAKGVELDSDGAKTGLEKPQTPCGDSGDCGLEKISTVGQ
jgi:hypothetical protein